MIIIVCLCFVFAVAAVVVVFFSLSLLVCFLVCFLYHIVLYISPRLYKHSLLYVNLSVISWFYLKVGDGQLESFRCFDHHR